jgi:hypothetical protein
MDKRYMITPPAVDFAAWQAQLDAEQRENADCEAALARLPEPDWLKTLRPPSSTREAPGATWDWLDDMDL